MSGIPAADLPVAEGCPGGERRGRDEWTDRCAIQLKLVPDVDVVAALDWVRAIWPVTVEVDCVLPAPMEAIVKEWDAGDRAGLAALRRLIARSDP